MPIRKIEDPWQPADSRFDSGPCLSPEHYPPTHMVFEPGRYEYTCPSCGRKTVFTVPSITV